jgi:hypothetical protein
VVKQFNNIVAFGALITERTDHVIVSDRCTTTFSLQKLVFTWFWRVACRWPTPVEAVMEHATALRVMGIGFVIAPHGLERCEIELFTSEAS